MSMDRNERNDNLKPFTCRGAGCVMSFSAADHLALHEKKHDMVLNLSINKCAIFAADQTPTPTRFIRNCEEVGLFQDLQNVNPFEETFRKAVELTKTGSTLNISSTIAVDDTLHTPHVFPNFPSINDDNIIFSPSNKSSAVLNDGNKHTNVNKSETVLNNSQSYSNKVQNDTNAEVINCTQNIKNNFKKILNTTMKNIKQDEIISNKTCCQKLEPNVLAKSSIEDKKDNCSVLQFKLDSRNCTENCKNNTAVSKSTLESVQEKKHITTMKNIPKNVSKYLSTPISNAKLKLKNCILKNGIKNCEPINKTPVIYKPIVPQNLPFYIMPRLISNSNNILHSVTTNQVNKIRPISMSSVPKDTNDVRNNQLDVLNNNDTATEKVNKKKLTKLYTNEKEREDHLARSRAASTRWRVKRNKTISHLKSHNKELELENKRLRLECNNLKYLLAAHKNCSVTKPMEIEQNNVRNTHNRREYAQSQEVDIVETDNLNS